MKVTHLEITTRIGCANACDYCPQDELVRAYKKRGGDVVMPLHVFCSCLHSVPRRVKIGFTGMCEPFLNPWAAQMVEYAAQKGHDVYVSTTLNGLRREDLPLLESLPFSLFAVHLPATAGDRIPTGDGYGGLLHAVAASKIRNVAFHFHGDTVHPSAERVLGGRAVKRARLISRAGKVRGVKPGKWLGPVTCRRGFGHPVLLPNGDLLLCCMDYGLRHVLGNLLDSPLNGIYQGDAFRAAMAESGKESGSLCHACDAYGEAR